MSEPTNQQLFNALSSNYVALAALLTQAATSGQWAAQGPIYLNGFPILGGHPDDDAVNKDVSIAGATIALAPDPVTGSVQVPGLMAPQLKRTRLESSRTLDLSDDGTLFLAWHASTDAAIALTLPEIVDEYDEENDAIIAGSTWYCQVFHAGSGVLTYAVSGDNQFSVAGELSASAITVPPGKAAIAVYFGAGLWGVF